MTTLVVCIRRHPELTRAEFSQYWHHVPGPMVRRCTDFARHLVSYDQHHVADQDGHGPLFGTTGDFDGVAVLSFRDSEAMARAFYEPRYLADIQPDESRFIDLARCVSYVTERVNLMPGSPAR
jgi:hypothetical protein